MTDIFKKIIVGLIPSFAITTFLLVFFSIFFSNAGMGFIPVFILSPFFAVYLAYRIGHVFFIINNVSIRVAFLSLLTIFSVGIAYLFGTDCNLQKQIGSKCNILEKQKTIYLTEPVQFPSSN